MRYKLVKKKKKQFISLARRKKKITTSWIASYFKSLRIKLEKLFLVKLRCPLCLKRSESV